MSKNNQNKNTVSVFSPYELKMHRIGRITTALALFGMFIPVIGVVMRYDIAVEWPQVFAATAAVWAAFGLNQIVEPFAFGPALGPAGTYMGFTTGNVAQLKAPCAVNSQEIMGVEPGTEEGDVVATLAVGVSNLVSTIMVFLTMLFVSVIYPVLSHPVIKPGIDNITAALFGALGMMIFLKDPKVASLPYALAAVIVLVMGPAWFNGNALWMMILLIIVAVLWAKYLFQKGALNKK